MNFLKKHYKNTIRSLIISKHNIINISQIPKIKNVNFRVKTDLKNNPKIWVLLFWSSFLLTGQKPFVKKKKETTSFTDTTYIYSFKVSLSKCNIYSFLSKYIYFIIPKIEDLDTYKSLKNKNNFYFEVKGYLNYFEFIETYSFLSDSELFLINHIKFGLEIKLTSLNPQANISLIRATQLPY